jgi:hypothetical protein
MGHRVGRSIDQAFPEEQSGNAASLNRLRQQGSATLFLGTLFHNVAPRCYRDSSSTQPLSGRCSARVAYSAIRFLKRPLEVMPVRILDVTSNVRGTRAPLQNLLRLF